MNSKGSQEEKAFPIPPTHGQDAKLIFHVTRKDKPSQKAEDSVDYRELSPFQEIKAGDIIVEKILPTPGIPGKDDSGNPIPPRPGKDVSFFPQNNIVELKTEKKITYKAKIDGVLIFDHKSANVEDVFYINSDVNLKTGNVDYKKNIFVKGDVKGGFSIQCGGDLYINGSVENNCQIICHGNLFVKRGIFGEKTEIEIRQNAEVEFIQNSNITVNGNLTVNKYIYDSKVTCRGNLNVLGRSVRDEDKGSVIGGRINSVGSMNLHSVGSIMAQTHLICGIDVERISKLEELNSLLQVLNKKLVSIQNRIGFDLSDPKASEKLNDLPIRRKNQIRELLIELKKISSEKQTALDKIKLLESYEDPSSVEDIKVIINKHIVPKILLEIGTVSEILDQPSKSKTFQIFEDKIIHKKTDNL